MDPLSVSAGFIAIIQISQTVISLLNDIKGKPADASRLMLELSAVSGLLQSLRFLVEERQDEAGWARAWGPLFTSEGPIQRLRVVLEQLTRKLSPTRDLRRVSKAILWPFSKSEIQSTLATIERVKSLISLAITQDEFGLSQAIASDTQRIQQDIQKLSLSSEKAARDLEFRSVLDWLSPLNSRAVQQDVLSRREEGTGIWFLEASIFKSWLDNDFPVLWCPGIPGSGKTIIASIVVDYLSNRFPNDNVGIAYVYFNYRQQYEQTIVNIVGTLLQHLLATDFEKTGAIAGDVLEVYRRHVSTHTRPRLDELTSLLFKRMPTYDRSFIVIDALDECPEGNGTRNRLLDVLRHLRNPSMKTSLFATSRFIPSIEVEFESQERLEIAADPHDIRKFVQYNIKRHRLLSQFVDRNPSLQETIVDTLTEKAQGMFLLARLQMDSLSTAWTQRRLLESLRRLPQSFDAVYSEMMGRIEEKALHERNLAHDVLFWVCHAQRPLTVQELQCALALEPGDAEVDHDSIVDESKMLEVCGALIIVDRVSNVIRLVHYTAQEYFERQRNVHFPLAEELIATTCLTCLSLDSSRSGPCISDKELEHRLESIPLLEYAAKHWGIHMRRQHAARITTLATNLLNDEKAVASTVQFMHLSSVRYPNYSQKYPRNVPGLQLAAYFDLENLARELLANGTDLEKENDYYGPPLQAAALGGSLSVSRLLVREGSVDVNARGGRFDTALQAAAFTGNESVASFLLEAGADPNAIGGLYMTPLQAASLEGHDMIARALVDNGAEVNVQFLGGRTALHCAATHGHIEIAKLLLENGATTDSRDSDHGRTALSWAAWNGHNNIVQLLLLKGASIDAVDHQNSTALHLALERHHQLTVRFLLDSGAKFDVVNNSNRTQVQIALASIEKIKPIEFELDIQLSGKLDRGSQAEVQVFRRKAEFQAYQANFELAVRKAFSTGDEYAQDIQRNLIRERQALQNLNHPNVVKYLNYEEDEDHDKAFLYTEYCDSGSLSKYVSFRKKPQVLNLYETWSIMYDLAAALAYCHHGLELDETGSFSLKHKWETILHRDIKPANVVLSNSDRGVPVAKLCDMGWAKVWSDPTGYQTRQVGSARYMPKEVRDGGSWTPKGDIHSLGATLRDLKRDFEDPEFTGFVNRCTEDNPCKRPSSFTLLEMASRRLSRIMSQPFTDKFLPHDYGESNYLFQAVLETLDRFFNTYQAVKSHRTREAASRLKLLISDWEGGETDIIQALNLAESPHLALILGDIEKAKSLIKLGKKDSKGRWETCGFTPLHIACREGYIDAVECWLKNKYEVDAQDDKGRTALHWAVFAGSLTLCHLLLKANADTDVVDDEGSTSFHRAAENGETEILATLLEGGAKINAKNKEGATALHKAAASGKLKAVQLLLLKGADSLAVDLEGFTPEQSATINGFQALGESLRMNSRLA